MKGNLTDGRTMQTERGKGGQGIIREEGDCEPEASLTLSPGRHIFIII